MNEPNQTVNRCECGAQILQLTTGGTLCADTATKYRVRHGAHVTGHPDAASDPSNLVPALALALGGLGK